MNQYAPTLNEQQKRAVARTAGRTLLLAVPGSGKTTVIIARLGYFIHGCGIPPSSILTMSYNVAAVRDLKLRFAATFGDMGGNGPEFRTINGFCAKVLEAYSHMTGRPVFRLMTAEGESARMLRRIFQELTGTYPSELQLKELQTIVTYARNRLLSEEEIQKIPTDTVQIDTVLKRYRAMKIRQQVMDYDDQLEYAYLALRKYPSLLAYFQQKYPHIQVDEAQDVSLIQHRIIRLLAGDSGSLLLVGDEDQSIYGFRAAYPQALLEFESFYPDGQVLTIEQNYRSVGTIIEGANRLIRFNRDRHDKRMFSDHPVGDPIRRVKLPGRMAQYRWIGECARECREQTAVLFRNNETALPMIDLLTATGTPFYCREHDELYLSQPIITTLCDGLRFALDPHNAALFEKLYYRFGLPISRSVMEETVRTHQKNPRYTLLETIVQQELCSDSVCARVRTLQRKLDWAARMKTRDGLELLRSETGLGISADNHKIDPMRFDILLTLATRHPKPGAFFRRLDELRQMVAEGQGAPGASFVLSTIHSAKGLEFDHVILADVWDGILPSAPDPDCTQEEKRLHMEEERRLFYVGVTRAKKHLTILEYGDGPAQFVGELLGLAAPQKNTPTPSGGIYPAGSRVRHRLLGYGTVSACDKATVTIVFDSPRKERKFDVGTCSRVGLIVPAE